EIKDIIRNFKEGQIDKKLCCEGKLLRWELEKFDDEHKDYEYTLKVHKIDQAEDQKGDTYLYRNIDTFLESKILPNPTRKILAIDKSLLEDLIYELLSSRKYLAEMTEEITDLFIVRRQRHFDDIHYDIDMIFSTVFNNLIEALTKDIALNHRIIDIIIKHLPFLKSNYPIIYSKFISVTSLIPNSFISKPHSYSEKKLVGYSCRFHDLEVSSYRESVFIKLFWLIRGLQMSLYKTFIKEDQTGITFINFNVPYAGFTKYPPDYSYWKELLRPKSSPFVTLVDQTFCE
ncbi:20435_t:CDS:2, partial [Funneliformis geosporum]